ncbi:hypothetical protein B0H14DRAFT_3136366 [Mycena olivaceomarginata]|nr:hypothetical protein B0H14DRAFT_3136366 [Mycena olivaceomarginata]
MDPVLACITLATFVKDVVELTRHIKDSIAKVHLNKEQLSQLEKDVEATVNDIVQLIQGYSNPQLSSELSSALVALQRHLESIRNDCKKASQHASWLLSWWNRHRIEREIRRLNELKQDCFDQFALFSTARTEGKADQIADTTTRIQGTAVQITDATARIEATAFQIVDKATRIEVETSQNTGTTARIEATTLQIVDKATRIEVETSQNAGITA